MKSIITLLTLILLLCCCTNNPMEPKTEVVNHYYTNTIEHNYYYTNIITTNHFYTNNITYISNYYYTNDLPFEYLIMTGYITSADYFNNNSYHTLVFSNSNITPYSYAEFYISKDSGITYHKIEQREYMEVHVLYSESNRIRFLDNDDMSSRSFEDNHYTLHVLIPEL